MEAEIPRYRLLAPLYDSSECQLWPEGTIISFRGSPNEHMEPLNDAAERSVREFLDQLDRMAELKAALDNRAFVKRAGDLGEAVAAEYTFEKRRSEPQRTSGEQRPVRTDLETPAQRRKNMRGRPKVVVDAVLPEAPKQAEGVGRVVPILGTDYTGDAVSRV